MPDSKARPIVEGGLLSAVSVVLALVSMYIPYAILIWPLPIALLGVRYGVRYGMMTAVVGAMAIGIMVHVQQGLFFLLGGGLVGVVLGECLRRKLSASKVLTATVAAALLANVALIGVAAVVMQVDVLQMTNEVQDMAVRMAAEFSQEMGGDEAQRAQIEAMGTELAQMMAMLAPTGLFLYALFTAVLNVMLVRTVLRRMRMEVTAFSPFESWQFPGWVLYLFVLSLVGIYWGGRWLSDTLMMVSSNVNSITSLALFVQGVSLLYYVSRHNQIVKRIWWLLVVFSLISPFFNIMMVTLGGIDILMNYRKIREKQV